ncbi:MAG: hypothetical protein ACFFHD_11880 [Promethearchaeota archaeon]
MALYPLDIINGIFSIIFIVISLLVGFRILSKYFKFNEKIYLFVGATWIFISEPWWPSGISFLLALTNEVGLPTQIYFLIGNIFTPFVIVLWLVAFTEFLYTEKRKLILIIFTIYGIIYEILFFVFLFINPDIIGELNPPVDVNYKSFIMFFLISFLAIVVFTGVLFARLSLQSDNPEVNLKGKMLLVAYFAFTIGALLDLSIPQNALLIIFARLILIISAFFWYGGFILPKWMRKIFLKKN